MYPEFLHKIIRLIELCIKIVNLLHQNHHETTRERSLNLTELGYSDKAKIVNYEITIFMK